MFTYMFMFGIPFPSHYSTCWLNHTHMLSVIISATHSQETRHWDVLFSLSDSVEQQVLQPRNHLITA